MHRNLTNKTKLTGNILWVNRTAVIFFFEVCDRCKRGCQLRMMELLVASAVVCIPRSLILFLHVQNISPIEIHLQLTLIFGNIMTIQHVIKWCREFMKGDETCMMWCSWGILARVLKIQSTIRALLDENRRLSIRQLEFLMKGKMGDPIPRVIIAGI